MINNGRLRNRIQILNKENKVTTLGSDKVIWKISKSVYAEIKPLRGKEYLENVALEHSLTYKITIRYTEIDATNYIKYKEKFFDIISPPIDVNNRHETLELMCKEHVGNDIEVEEDDTNGS